MSYQLYRNTTLGNTLQESLDELIQVSVQNYRARSVQLQSRFPIDKYTLFLNVPSYMSTDV